MSKSKLLKHTTNYHNELIESLKNPIEALAYLQVAFDEYQQDNDIELLLVALRNVAEANGGIAKLASKSRLNRQSLYRTLSEKGNPRLDTLGLVLNALGYRLSIQPIRRR